jgi:hypothetical protein
VIEYNKKRTAALLRNSARLQTGSSVEGQKANRFDDGL